MNLCWLVPSAVVIAGWICDDASDAIAACSAPPALVLVVFLVLVVLPVLHVLAMFWRCSFIICS